jgi:hypothetical protein
MEEGWCCFGGDGVFFRSSVVLQDSCLGSGDSITLLTSLSAPLQRQPSKLSEILLPAPPDHIPQGPHSQKKAKSGSIVPHVFPNSHH